MPGNTTVGSTLLDEDFRRVLLEREQECLQLQAMNSTPPPGRIYYVRSCRNINSSLNSRNLHLWEFIKSRYHAIRVFVCELELGRSRRIECKFLHVDSKLTRGLLRFVECKNANDTSLQVNTRCYFSYFLIFFLSSFEARDIFLCLSDTSASLLRVQVCTVWKVEKL